MPNERFYTIAYDIPDDGRRVKVANVLKSFGERVQLSVFECWLAPGQLQQLKQLLQKKLELSQDSVRIYPIGGTVEVLGLGRLTQSPDFLIL
ncbi:MULTISPECIES: CRISPR-associated endonuclease Cas2 [Meiothermus]|uniref:CRISPR-associated endoribonuclease Cas2 n=1 Tax=Meiothermus taiwanensis TaxID=172827 RepID=A0A399ECK5_9DEIN|nr:MULTISPECIES: CRISPR-associated endonuclease Cas2 [Meiothermus]RIH79882.1 CRISPR-associated endonuclease Cas2 2 [Meiothermus taiwanensis]GAO73922.1 CRISPR-associated protein Cas2 [Meiothermus ruber H328]